ncbi:unannotated protein [freshwater metagenome]|uniref:Unannotated protein n=1 Tax=freshwater metagenome TaxID=449393 RepID=A0A6J7J7C2_9ZZZZ
MTGDALDRGDRGTGGTEHCLDGCGFGGIVEWGRRAMGVHVGDIGRGQSGIVNGHTHTGDGSDATGGGSGDVMGIGVGCGAHEFGEDVGASGFGRLPFLEHQDARTFGENEAVSVTVEWT